MNVYKTCPVLENDRFTLRLTEDSDKADLLKVYSDVKAVPFFNGDNCHGDDFHYTTPERVQQAVDFWKQAYENGWFVRFSIADKKSGEIIGTIEEFHRDADDYFTNCGLLRLDLRSDFENAEAIKSIMSLIVQPSFELFYCDMIATKAISAASERRKALVSLGFTLSPEKLVGFDGTQYSDYFVVERAARR